MRSDILGSESNKFSLPGEHGEGSDLEGLGHHPVNEAGRASLEDSLRGLGSHVALGETGPA